MLFRKKQKKQYIIYLQSIDEINETTQPINYIIENDKNDNKSRKKSIKKKLTHFKKWLIKVLHLNRH